MLAVLIAAFALIAFALRPHAGTQTSSQARAAVLPRPTASPPPAWGAAARSDLRTAIASALRPALAGASDWSCIVLAADGTVLYDDRGSHAVTPASAQKLIVADAALAELGPAFRYDTLFAAGHPPQNGAIDGDLWLAGSGDPSLRSDDLRNGVAALRRSGVTSISGGVAVDPSALAGEEINPLWNADDANEDFMAATSGISVDEDTVEFHVTGTSPGEAANVSLKPAGPDVRYYGSVETGGGDDVVIAGTETPNLFRLAGNVPPGIEETFYLPVHGVAHYAGTVVDRMLDAAGIAKAKPAVTGTVPVDASVLWDHRSKPLRDLLKHMLVHSDNHFAEQIMRTVGGVDGSTANDADGLAAERQVLIRQGIPVPNLHTVDGSGLAHANRVAAATLAGILSHADRDPRGNALYPLLPRGGKDGTLQSYHFEDAAGRVRAKSGHLDDASSLAGYVATRRHGRVVFAFLINGSPGDPDAAIVSAVDRLAAR